MYFLFAIYMKLSYKIFLTNIAYIRICGYCDIRIFFSFIHKIEHEYRAYTRIDIFRATRYLSTFSLFSHI